jgi:hypothetical protein
MEIGERSRYQYIRKGQGSSRGIYNPTGIIIEEHTMATLQGWLTTLRRHVVIPTERCMKAATYHTYATA